MKDKRSGKVVFVSHCLLNQNSKVQGVASYPGVVTPLFELLCSYEAGIVQLPCPEEKELGVGRPAGDDTKQMYDTPSYRNTCLQIAKETINRIRDYRRNGYKVICILGVDGSPSCGVNVSPIRQESKTVLMSQPGIFSEVLSEEMRKDGVSIPLLGIAESSESGSLEETLKRLENILLS